MNPFEQSEPFDTLQHRFLGKYIYILIDPRDHCPFYVGQGHKDRAGSHFEAARRAMIAERLTPKTRRIAEIWGANLQVRIVIARRRLRDDIEANQVEGALIQSLRQFGHPLTNAVEAPQVDEQGWMTVEDVRRRAAPPVNPGTRIDRVHLFKIEDSVRDRVARGMPDDAPGTYFDALRRSWYKDRTVNAPPTGYAAGYVGTPAVSIVACRIAGWEQCDVVGGAWAMVSALPADEIVSQLELKNWSRVITGRGGAVSYGSPCQIEFDGQGRFKFLSGAADKTTWHDLV